MNTNTYVIFMLYHNTQMIVIFNALTASVEETGMNGRGDTILKKCRDMSQLTTSFKLLGIKRPSGN